MGRKAKGAKTKVRPARLPNISFQVFKRLDAEKENRFRELKNRITIPLRVSFLKMTFHHGSARLQGKNTGLQIGFKLCNLICQRRKLETMYFLWKVYGTYVELLVLYKKWLVKSHL